MVHTRAQGLRRKIAELVVGYALILAVLWTPRPYQRRLYFLAAAFLILVSLFSGETLQGLGLSGRNLLRSSLIILLATIVCGASILTAASLGVLHGPGNFHEFVRRYWGYTIWSFAQQFLLQDFFLLRFLRILPDRPGGAIVAAAGVFALAHLPNPILTAFTMIWGLIACAAFERRRSLYPLGVAHAMLGITVAVVLPGTLTHNMHVGLGYYHYRSSLHNNLDYRRVKDQTVSTKVCVKADAPTLWSLRQALP